ncbi:MAG: MgtC/SapB family protein [Pseudomonadota bacterium]
MLRFQALAWAEVIAHLVDLALAYLLALPIGWDREAATEGRAGLRTFPIVAMASCGFILVGIGAFGAHAPGLSSVLYGLIVGIGFIGSGTIMKSDSAVKGNTTAASIWATGAIGASVGFALYDIAVILSVATFITLRLKTRQREP